MRLLLDTHIALWATQDSPRLPGEARALLMAAQPGTVFVSVVSLWELSIKAAAGQFRPDASEARKHFVAARYHFLEMTDQHAATHDALGPPHADHKDPFDRMLVAQAISEGMVLVTHDPKLARYHPVAVRLV